jgi:hypothetical protein
MFIWVVIVSLGIAWLRGGKLERLGYFPLRHMWLVFLAFGLQFLLHLPAAAGVELIRQAAPYLYASAYYLLLICFAINRRVPGVFLLAAGALANLTAIMANGGKMPVAGNLLAVLGHESIRDSFASGASLTHQLITPTTRLPWLGDVILGTPPFPNPTVFSVGDVLLAAGVFILVQATMVPSRAASEDARDPAAAP